MTHSEYCHNRMTRLNSSFGVESDGKCFWVVNGKRLTPQQMDEQYPISGRLQSWKDKENWKGENPDKRNNWQN